MSVIGGPVRREADLDALLEVRGLGRTGTTVSPKRALQQSVIWGARHVRADVISLMPIDVYRKVAGARVESFTPPVLQTPCEIAPGQLMPIEEWMYSTQGDLDTTGNTIGIIHKTDGLGLPAVIEPVDWSCVTIRVKGSKIHEYRVSGEKVDSKFIWHERQFTIAGFPIGMSPITNAALSLSAGLSAQEFALAWFTNGGAPSAILKNNEKIVPKAKALEAKTQFRESVASGDIFVTGKDWEYTALSVKAAEAEFIAQMQYTDVDLCRFMGVPADIVNVVVQGGSAITYANMLQRNLQFLVMNLGGAVMRREKKLSTLTPGGRFVKLNRNAVLAMDPKTRNEVFESRMRTKSIAPSEIRAHEDEPSFTDEQIAELEQFGIIGSRTPNQPQTAGGDK
jgi:HK97 family phage portal protein